MHCFASVKVKGHMVKVKGHICQDQIRVPTKGRWAHIKIKLRCLSVSVPMHSGLLCINFCLSVTGPKFTRKSINSHFVATLFFWSAVENASSPFIDKQHCKSLCNFEPLLNCI